MFRRALLIFSLMLLFGFSQQGAMLHTYSHVANQQEDSQQDSKFHHMSFCDKCAAYTALDTVIGTGNQLLLLVHSQQDDLSSASFQLDVRHTQHYSSRAPPVFV